jgi:hypothetical protein
MNYRILMNFWKLLNQKTILKMIKRGTGHGPFSVGLATVGDGGDRGVLQHTDNARRSCGG